MRPGAGRREDRRASCRERDVQLGLIGLGRMGGNMRDRVRAAGHEVVGYDPRPEVTDVPSLE
ncbi:NAD(P)-binding domain-containing protein, partial [Pseudonocardia kujensis]|uniref:NAD(P)-binding domain-containing protein n=1 Tax=Pseudonocardia kujensis TaxID=1128675 RepID=UPI001E34E12D